MYHEARTNAWNLLEDHECTSAATHSDVVRVGLESGIQQIQGLFCDVDDCSLFDDLRAELHDLQMQQQSKQQDGTISLAAVRMDETTDKIWMNYKDLPAHTSVLRKLEAALDTQSFAWGSNLYEDDSVPCEFHRDGDTYSAGATDDVVADISIIASFGGSRNFTFIHCTTGREFSFLQGNGDVIAFNRNVDNEFMHGLRPSPHTDENTERISVVIFGRSQVSKREQVVMQRLPIPRVVSMSCPHVKVVGGQNARLLQFTGVFVSQEQVHLDPKELPMRRRQKSILSGNSLEHAREFCQNLGGRFETMETSSDTLGSLQCFVFEPSSKSSEQQPVASMGVVICLQGLPLTTGSLQEWRAAAQRAGWLEMGITVIVPNLHMSPAFDMSDYEAVINAALASGKFHACLLAGKDDGACLCVRIAVESAASAEVVGVVLVGPSSPPPLTCCRLRVPALLLWAIDDEVCQFEERHEWIRTLDERAGATSFKESARGGHRLDCVLDISEFADAVRHFTVASFFVHELEGNDGHRDRLSFFNRFSTKLPYMLHVLIAESGLAQHGFDKTSASDSMESKHYPAARARHHVSNILQSWIQADMVMASASE